MSIFKAHKHTGLWRLLLGGVLIAALILPISIQSPDTIEITTVHAQTTVGDIGSAVGSALSDALGFVGNGIVGILEFGVKWILGFILGGIGSIMLLVAEAFDAAIQYTVIDFGGEAVFGEGFEEGINLAWSAFRDVANIVMIAMFVFIALAIILNTGKVNFRELGVRIVIIALLINFSLFFTKVIIDISNVTATQFVQSINLTGSDEINIAQGFLQKSGLGEISFTTAANNIDAMNSVSGVLIYTFVMLTLYSLMLAIFVLGFVLLISRAVVLLLLMALSSLAFAAYLIPKYGEPWWNKWWSTLIQNALFAPLLMLMLWASAQITGGLTSGNVADLVKTSVDNNGVFEIGTWRPFVIVFIIAGMLYASHRIASSLSLAGAGFAKDLSNRALGRSLSLSAAPLIPFQKLGAYMVRQSARGIRENVPVGARLNAALSRLETRPLNFGDSKAAKALEKKTGVRLGFQSASTDDIAAYRRMRERSREGGAAQQQTPAPPVGDTGTAKAQGSDLLEQQIRAATNRTAEPKEEVTQEAIDRQEFQVQVKQADLQNIQQSIQNDIASGQLTADEATRKRQDAQRLQGEIGREQQKIKELKEELDRRQQAQAAGKTSDAIVGGRVSTSADADRVFAQMMQGANETQQSQQTQTKGPKRIVDTVRGYIPADPLEKEIEGKVAAMREKDRRGEKTKSQDPLERLEAQIQGLEEIAAKSQSDIGSLKKDDA